jgi:translation initiation factor IF-3
MKEIRFGPNTDEHDVNFKLKHARNVPGGGPQGEGLRVLQRAAPSSSRSAARSCLLKFAQDLEDIGLVESMPKLEGKRMIMFLIPKKKK